MVAVSPARVAAVRVVRVAKEVRVDVIVVRFIFSFVYLLCFPLREASKQVLDGF